MKAFVAFLAVAAAQATPVVIADGDERLSGPRPSGFHVGSTDSSTKPTIVELIPDGETVSKWREMITRRRELNRKDGIDRGYMTSYVAAAKAACPGLVRGAWIPDMGMKGADQIPLLNGYANGYRKTVAGVRCPRSPATGGMEDFTVVVFQGANSLFFIQYAFDHVPSEAEEARRLQYLRAAEFCALNDPKHPCVVDRSAEAK